MSLSNNFPTIRPTLLLDFANSNRLDPRVTFTRASTATYYDGVTTAKAEENLVTYSQPLNVGWVKFGTATITDNNAVAPDGATAAALISSPATDDYAYQVTNTNIGQIYVFSVYVKNSTATISRLWVRTSSTAAAILLNWSGATLSSVTQTTGTATFTAVGNDWYRVVVTYTAVETAARLRIYGGDGTSTTGNILVWGVQLEQRSSVTAYTATTTQPITNYIPVLLTAQNNVPRFDHNPTTGAALGLLIEEQRTNSLTYSDDFANAAWTKTDSSITSNTIAAPDGTLTGDKLFENSANNVHRVERSQSISASTAYTFSFYAKAAERTVVYSRNDSTGANANAAFNLANGTVQYQGAGQTASIQSVGNGWYRCIVTATSGAAITTGVFRISISNTAVSSDSAITYTGDGYSGIYIWGAQLEAGAFATSYIPTTTTALTRNADVASMTGTNFSSWYNASEGTLFAQVTAAQNASTAYVTLSNGNQTQNSIYFDNDSGNMRNVVFSSSSAVAVLNLGLIGTVGAVSRLAAAYQVNNFAAVRNGGTVQTDTLGAVPASVSQMNIGASTAGAAASYINGHIQRLAYYATRLTNAQLQALTL